ncbi:DUF4752 family protein [Enterobacter kobei]|nr:DUF4752 family protein [Enterobacter kobei]
MFAALFVLPVSTWRVYVTSYKSQPAQSSAEQSGYCSLSRRWPHVANELYDAFDLSIIEPGTTVRLATKGDLTIMMYRTEGAAQ